MTGPRLVATNFGGPAGGPLLLLGPSLGTSAQSLWGPAAQHLTGHFRVVAWDLPGHGHSPPASPFDVDDLAAAVLALADEACTAGGFHYAGDSLGGAVGLQLLLAAPDRVHSATLICTGAVIGTPAGWRERAHTVRASGVDALVDVAAERWFSPGFLDRAPEAGAALLTALRATDAESYALACEALAAFDVTARLAEIAAPVLAIAGSDDVPTPPQDLRRIADGVADGRLVVLPGVGHLAPAEAPQRVAELVVEHVHRHRPDAISARSRSLGDGERAETTRYDAGMAVRRQVLGNDHVDRAQAQTTPFSADFQTLITEYAWGSIWTRPGLDRRSRSLITLTALVARGHHEELAMHVRAARRNGLSVDEIKELLLQTAIYCGVPDANTAFRIAGRVLAEDDAARDNPTRDTEEEPS
ncbi:4-carboxymuconolactone decarboxylase [Mycobacterium sp. CPCC 205372]|uniref:4-carboxymuconolactone decarboxylase n=1 Tax=Mycobacterium hippophais TaxID=3016340 RepID=A0ABT4PS64_9MYCO|nr:4-carboxymuconolactone decarboxylase [Mycobacterium hippophais]MCZ8379393.1 4-carboxymuconolactone decarboxylase [Mycobacterium hippophais]